MFSFSHFADEKINASGRSGPQPKTSQPSSHNISSMLHLHLAQS